MRRLLRRSILFLFHLVLPIIQHDPDLDEIQVIQHHHVSLTCTASGEIKC